MSVCVCAYVYITYIINSIFRHRIFCPKCTQCKRCWYKIRPLNKAHTQRFLGCNDRPHGEHPVRPFAQDSAWHRWNGHANCAPRTRSNKDPAPADMWWDTPCWHVVWSDTTRYHARQDPSHLAPSHSRGKQPTWGKNSGKKRGHERCLKNKK